MSQFQHIARILLAAGYAEHPQNKGIYLLYVNPERGSLISKIWNQVSFGEQDLIATNVRPDSSASYLISPDDSKFVVYISSSSTVQFARYDDGEEEWVEDNSGAQYMAHRHGKLAALFGGDGRIRVFFQDPSERLAYFGSSSKPTVFEVKPTVGSPITTVVINGREYVFYISSRDRYVHYITETRHASGDWSDNILVPGSFETNPRQFIVVPNQEGGFEAYALTEESTLLQIANGKVTVLGKVDEEGKFISERIIDQCCNDAWDACLDAERLKNYLANDPFIIDIPGGNKSVTPLAAACWRGHLDVVNLLLSHGANPNALSPQNRTPLYYATSRGSPRTRTDIVRALVDAGARVDESYPENSLNTPLMNAIIAIDSDKEVVQELLKRGASLTVKNAQGLTAEMLAKGTDFEVVLQQWKKELTRSNALKEAGPLGTRLIDFLVTLLMFIIAYTQSDVADNIIGEIKYHIDMSDDVEKDTDPEMEEFSDLD